MNTTIPHFIDFGALTGGGIAFCVITGLLSILLAAILGAYCSDEFGGNRKRAILVSCGITMLVTLSCICFFGFSAATIRGIIICLALIYCSYSDIKLRECGNAPFLLIAVAALIGCPLTNLPNMLLAGFVAFVLQFGGAVATDAELNGADLKCACACCFALGMARGLFGLVTGMILAIAVNLVRLCDRKAGFPLLPYLAAGFMTAYFI